jgi:phosphoenolpyruvate carboxykinase (GTP)
MGATLSSETTAAATGKVGVLRRDPMAMLPFCGYNMADYFAHWLDVGKKLSRPPAIFRVNWFRTGEDGRFLWPGFGENLRVLKWVLERCDGEGEAVETAIGIMPTLKAIDRTGINMGDDAMKQLLRVDLLDWTDAVHTQAEFFKSLGSRLPSGIVQEHEGLMKRVHDAIAATDLYGRDLGA